MSGAAPECKNCYVELRAWEWAALAIGFMFFLIGAIGTVLRAMGVIP